MQTREENLEPSVPQDQPGTFHILRTLIWGRGRMVVDYKGEMLSP